MERGLVATKQNLPEGTVLEHTGGGLRTVRWVTVGGRTTCELAEQGFGVSNYRDEGQTFAPDMYRVVSRPTDAFDPVLGPHTKVLPEPPMTATEVKRRVAEYWAAKPGPSWPIKAKPGDWLASLTGPERKECAIARGLYAYFPDALAAVARHSIRSNEKHNPGQEPHWARDKSTDHADCIGRHSIAVAANPDALDDGQPEVVCRAWRALADLQLWIEGKVAKGEKV